MHWTLMLIIINGLRKPKLAFLKKYTYIWLYKHRDNYIFFIYFYFLRKLLKMRRKIDRLHILFDYKIMIR